MKTKVSKSSRAMESRDHFKNGASLKSQMSKVNILRKSRFALLTTAIILSVTVVFAQEQNKMYVKLNAGYSFNAGKTTCMNGQYENTSINGISSGTLKDMPVSLGRGFNVNLGFGYMLNEYVGIELNVDYLNGSTPDFENKSSSSSTITDPYGTTFEYKYADSYKEKMQYSRIAVTPAIKLVAPLSNSLSVYSRLGIAIPIMNNAVSEYENEYSGTSYGLENSSSRKNKTKFTAFFNIGYSAAFGINYSISDNLSLFAETNLVASSFQVKKAEITESKSTTNGVTTDNLKDMDICDKETEYLKEYKWSSTDEPNKDKPGKDVSYTLPSSRVGVTVGVIFRF